MLIEKTFTAQEFMQEFDNYVLPDADAFDELTLFDETLEIPLEDHARVDEWVAH